MISSSVETGIVCARHGVLYGPERVVDVTKMTNVMLRHLEKYHPRLFLKLEDEILRGKYTSYNDHH